MNKKIEDMANDLRKSEFWYFDDTDCDFELDRKKTAENLYTAGYCKQREGRWVRNEDHNAYESPYFCSECLADCSDIQGENYCYNCGAKMKGDVGK